MTLANQFPYYSWYPGDFKSSTSHFTLTEKAIYRELLDWSWLNGPLPENDRRLAQICGCSLRSFRASWREVRTKFVANGDGLINRRLEEIRSRTLEISEKRSEAGRAGGKASAKANAVASAKQTGKQNSSSQSQSQSQSSSSPSETHNTGARDLRFSRFWQTYPKKVGKGDARRAFDRAEKKGMEIDVALAAVERCKSTAQWQRGVIPNPSTWLNQERWEDDPETIDAGEDTGWQVAR